jgi:hypothetical protein
MAHSRRSFPHHESTFRWSRRTRLRYFHEHSPNSKALSVEPELPEPWLKDRSPILVACNLKCARAGRAKPEEFHVNLVSASAFPRIDRPVPEITQFLAAFWVEATSYHEESFAIFSACRVRAHFCTSARMTAVPISRETISRKSRAENQ